MTLRDYLEQTQREAQIYAVQEYVEIYGRSVPRGMLNRYSTPEIRYQLYKQAARDQAARIFGTQLSLDFTNDEP